MKAEVPIRITLVGPPEGVRYAVQRGKHENVDHKTSNGGDLVFDLTVTYQGRLESDKPRFTGPFAQGPAEERFVYLTIGTSAGDFASPWTRRAKIHVSGIDPQSVERVLANPGSVIAARFTGTAKDGSPACASLRPIDGEWRINNA